MISFRIGCHAALWKSGGVGEGRVERLTLTSSLMANAGAGYLPAQGNLLYRSRLTATDDYTAMSVVGGGRQCRRGTMRPCGQTAGGEEPRGSYWFDRETEVSCCVCEESRGGLCRLDDARSSRCVVGLKLALEIVGSRRCHGASASRPLAVVLPGWQRAAVRTPVPAAPFWCDRGARQEIRHAPRQAANQGLAPGKSGINPPSTLPN